MTSKVLLISVHDDQIARNWISALEEKGFSEPPDEMCEENNVLILLKQLQIEGRLCEMSFIFQAEEKRQKYKFMNPSAFSFTDGENNVRTITLNINSTDEIENMIDFCKLIGTLVFRFEKGIPANVYSSGSTVSRNEKVEYVRFISLMAISFIDIEIGNGMLWVMVQRKIVFFMSYRPTLELDIKAESDKIMKIVTEELERRNGGSITKEEEIIFDSMLPPRYSFK